MISLIFSFVFFKISIAATGLSALSGLFADQYWSNFFISSSIFSLSLITLSLIDGILLSISLLFLFKICSNLLHSLSSWSKFAKSPLNLYLWESKRFLLSLYFSISLFHISLFFVKFLTSVIYETISLESFSKLFPSKLFLASLIVALNCFIPSFVICANLFITSLCHTSYLFFTFVWTPA